MEHDTMNCRYSAEKIRGMQDFLLEHKDRVEEAVTYVDFLDEGPEGFLMARIGLYYSILRGLDQLPLGIRDYGPT